jgi:Lon protease-like protein
VSVREIPLFPLPLVLFPGTPLPLHVFEPRYQRMLADCLAADRTFGIIYRPEGVPERALPAGTVGCMARVTSVDSLPDGRSNILVSGDERFRLVGFVDSPHPYHMARVEPYEDERESTGPLVPVAARVRGLFERVARAARVITEEPADIPPVSENPSLLSFAIASVVDLDADARQQLLASRSPMARLRTIEALLDGAVATLEERAAVHQRARGNGHGPVEGA